MSVIKEEIECDQVDDNESETKDSKFYCYKCGNSFLSVRSLKRHEQSAHTNDESRKRNQKSFKSEQMMEDEDSNKTIACNECTERFTTNEEYLRHKIVHKKSFECDVCQKVSNR